MIYKPVLAAQDAEKNLFPLRVCKSLEVTDLLYSHKFQPLTNKGMQFVSLCGLLVAIISISGCGAIHNTMMLEMNKVQFGMASWYGNDLHGRATSSGEKYDMNDFTAAHRTLPFGTSVRVTNVENGRSAVVRINDRGPRKLSRKIDLSYAAAEKIGMLQSGTTRVRIDILDDETATIALEEQKAQQLLPTNRYIEQFMVYDALTSFDKKRADEFRNGKPILIGKIPAAMSELVADNSLRIEKFR